MNLAVHASLWNFSEEDLKVAKVNKYVVFVRSDIINSKEKKRDSPNSTHRLILSFARRAHGISLGVCRLPAE